MRLETLLGVLDRAANYVTVPCRGSIAGLCAECRKARSLKADILEVTAILRAEASEQMRTGVPFGAKSKKIRK
jgi:hypothetical protein